MKLFLKSLFLFIIFATIAWQPITASTRLTKVTSAADRTGNVGTFADAVDTIIPELQPKGTLPKELPAFQQQVNIVFENAKKHVTTPTLTAQERQAILAGVSKLVENARLFFTHQNLTTTPQQFGDWLTKTDTYFRAEEQKRGEAAVTTSARVVSKFTAGAQKARGKKELEAQTKKSQEALDALAAEKQKLEEAKRRLDQERKQQEEALTAATKKMADEEKAQRAKEEEAEKQATALRAQIAAASGDAARSQTLNTQLVAQLEEQKRDAEAAQRRLAAFEVDKQQKEDAARAAQEKLEENNADLQTKTQQQQNQIEKLRMQLEDVRSAHDADAREAAQNAATLHAQILSLQASGNASATELESKRKEFERLQAEKSEADKAALEAQKQLTARNSALERDRQQLEGDLKKLSSELETARLQQAAEVARLQKANEEKDRLATEAQQIATATQTRLNALEAKLEETKKQSGAQVAELSARLEAEKAALKAQLELDIQRQTERTNAVTLAKEALQRELIQAREQLESQKNLLETTQKYTQEQLAAKELVRAQAEKDAAEAKATLEKTKAENAASMSELQKQLASTTSTSAADKSRLEKELRDLQASQAALEEKQRADLLLHSEREKQKEKEKSDLLRKQKELEEQQEKLAAKLAEAEKALAETKAAAKFGVAIQKSLKKKAEQKAAAAETARFQEQRKAAEAVKEAKSSEEKAIALQQEVAVLKPQMATLQKERDEAQIQAKALTDENEKLKKENAEVAAALKRLEEKLRAQLQTPMVERESVSGEKAAPPSAKTSPAVATAYPSAHLAHFNELSTRVIDMCLRLTGGSLFAANTTLGVNILTFQKEHTADEGIILRLNDWQRDAASLGSTLQSLSVDDKIALLEAYVEFNLAYAQSMVVKRSPKFSNNNAIVIAINNILGQISNYLNNQLKPKTPAQKRKTSDLLAQISSIQAMISLS